MILVHTKWDNPNSRSLHAVKLKFTESSKKASEDQEAVLSSPVSKTATAGDMQQSKDSVLSKIIHKEAAKKSLTRKAPQKPLSSKRTFFSSRPTEKDVTCMHIQGESYEFKPLNFFSYKKT